MKDVIILRGIPGAGKSTFAQLLTELEGTVICSQDDFFIKDGKYQFDKGRIPLAVEFCKEKFDKAIESNAPRIILDNTNVEGRFMSYYVNKAKSSGYRVFRLIVENINGTSSVHNVPLSTINSMKTRFEIKL